MCKCNPVKQLQTWQREKDSSGDKNFATDPLVTDLLKNFAVKVKKIKDRFKTSRWTKLEAIFTNKSVH